MKNICIIGAGNIGSRHLQALKKVKFPLSIDVVDTSTNSLIIAKERYQQIQSDTKHKVKFLKDINYVSKKINLALIATNSDVRSYVVKQLLVKSNVKYFILEKLLFQKRNDYDAIQRLLTKYKCKAWVNCSRRTMPFYYNLKNQLRGQNPNCIITGGQYGLITTSIHFIDYIAFLTDCHNFKINTDNLDSKPIKSKRKGFLEFNGTLTVNFSNGSYGVFTCHPKGNAPIIVEILSENFRCISRESGEKAWISKGGKWGWKEVNTNLLYQSEMTNLIVEDIFKTGDCNLTTYAESAKLHLILLETLLGFLNHHSKKKFNYYPFT